MTIRLTCLQALAAQHDVLGGTSASVGPCTYMHGPNAAYVAPRTFCSFDISSVWPPMRAALNVKQISQLIEPARTHPPSNH